MVLHLCPDSREISFRHDDCLTQKAGQLLPIGVIKVYMIWGPKSITGFSGFLRYIRLDRLPYAIFILTVQYCLHLPLRDFFLLFSPGKRVDANFSFEPPCQFIFLHF
jgi:hypothetical protein